MLCGGKRAHEGWPACEAEDHPCKRPSCFQNHASNHAPAGDGNQHGATAANIFHLHRLSECSISFGSPIADQQTLSNHAASEISLGVWQGGAFSFQETFQLGTSTPAQQAGMHAAQGFRHQKDLEDSASSSATEMDCVQCNVHGSPLQHQLMWGHVAAPAPQPMLQLRRARSLPESLPRVLNANINDLEGFLALQSFMPV